MMVKDGRAVSLATILHALPVREVCGDASVAVSDVTADSREAAPGMLFVALRGFHADGHAFLREAAARGAAGAVVERPDPSVSMTQVVVSDARLALGAAAAEVHGHPSRAMDLLGATGTNGKTTVVYMVRSIFETAGRACGVLGTLGYRWGENEIAPSLTTPGPDKLHRILARMRRDGVRAAAMEASSHAVALRRLVALRFRAMALTNVTRDHLDFHGSVEAYRREKMRLFLPAELAEDRVEVGAAVLNADDETGARLLSESPLPRIAYGEAEGADLKAVILRSGICGTALRLLRGGEEAETTLPLPGAFNVQNGLAAVGLALQSGLTLAEAAAGLAACEPPPGRMERVDRGQPFGVVIDYAHTPDGFRRLLDAIRLLTEERVILVFGCGGERDRGKRPIMGRIASEKADLVLLTDDNPRGEDPETIRREVEGGLREGNGVYERIPDREEAIARAFALARRGDTVVLAGKGHERYQIVGEEKRPWNERRVAEKLLDARREGAR
ncbi:MAG: UDP-N-acetylmuramoyl-L-alanyl-D-glutamate--2,6-diaminopimelate ligase [Candidatus Eisenbacteria bacterium]